MKQKKTGIHVGIALRFCYVLAFSRARLNGAKLLGLEGAT
jgi:hypothetical protein